MTPTHAELFMHSDVIAPWTSRWGAEDPVQCDGLNLEARYYLSLVTAIDLGSAAPTPRAHVDNVWEAIKHGGSL